MPNNIAYATTDTSDDRKLALTLHQAGHSVTYTIDGDTIAYLVVLGDGKEYIVTEWPLGCVSIDPAH